jgi:putative ABC transport system permease protein
MAEWIEEMRHALRGLRQQPGFTAAAVLMLALGIGATTLMFSVVNGVLINPLPYPDSGALVRVSHLIGGRDMPWFSDAVYLTYADNSQTFQDVGVWMGETTATISGHGDPEEVHTLTASQSLLTVLGVQPEFGRWFSKAEDSAGAADVVMLTHAYWHRKTGGDRGILARTLTINGRRHQIVGVMPATFRFGEEFDLIVPLRIDRGRPVPGFRLEGVARLKPGVTLAQANADAGRIVRLWLTASGPKDPAFLARYAPALRPLKQDVIGTIGTTLWVLMATIGMVLLMACANVANLLLVRAEARRQEFAIRAALGAGWTRLARQLLVESATLAVMGGIAGVALAYGGLRVLIAIGPANLPRLPELSIDATVLGFALAASLLSGLLFGIIPIIKYARPQLAHAMAAGGRGVGLTRESQRSQQALVTIQIAAALVLLVSAGLMIRSFYALRGVEPGFVNPQHLQSFALSIPQPVVAEPERVMRLQRDILDKISSIPGVTSAAFATRLPAGPGRASTALAAHDIADDGRTPPNRHMKAISPGMFQTMGIPIVAGRDFTWNDLEEGRDSRAIVSENLAREYWGASDAAIGKRIREYYGPKDAWREVVGVSGDVYDDGAHQPPPATVYFPEREPRRVSVIIRTERAGTAGLLAQVQDAVWSVHRTLPLSDVRTLDDVFAESMARTSFTLVMLAVAGTMALLLGIFGLYGVLSYAVSQRRPEIGIRLALGAQPREIRRLFLRRGLMLTAVGVIIGLAAAKLFVPVLRSLLFGIEPVDPITFAATPIVLAAAAALASYLPTRRAVAIDPVETLRAK